MLQFNANGEIEVGGEQTRTLNGWLLYDRLHNKKLQLDNPTVQKVLEKFNVDDWMKNYSLLRQVYWKCFLDEKDFLTAVENNLAKADNIDQLVDKIVYA